MDNVELEIGRRVLSQQPFSTLMGTKMTILEIGKSELTLDLRNEHQQQHGFAHGGVISYLADNALGFAGGSLFGDAVTLEFKVNYVRPAVGERIIARARVTAGGRSQAVCHCDVFIVKDKEEKLCATAQGTISKLDSAA